MISARPLLEDSTAVGLLRALSVHDATSVALRWKAWLFSIRGCAPIFLCHRDRRALPLRRSQVRMWASLCCYYTRPSCFREILTSAFHQALPSASFRFYTASNNDLPAIRRHVLHPVASRDPSRGGPLQSPRPGRWGKLPKDCGAPVTSTKKGAERRDLPLDSDVCTRRLY